MQFMLVACQEHVLSKEMLLEMISVFLQVIGRHQVARLHALLGKLNCQKCSFILYAFLHFVQ